MTKKKMSKVRFHRFKLHHKKIQPQPLPLPANPPRKRGRPRKTEAPKQQMMEPNNSKGYTAAEQEALRAYYRKAIQLFKIKSGKQLMGRMGDIQKYLYQSREYGLLDLPFPPYKNHIETEMLSMLRYQ